MQQRNYILEALAQARTRQSWNERLAHWERPASDSEEAMIERAARSVRDLMSSNTWACRRAGSTGPSSSPDPAVNYCHDATRSPMMSIDIVAEMLAIPLAR